MEDIPPWTCKKEYILKQKINYDIFRGLTYAMLL